MFTDALYRYLISVLNRRVANVMVCGNFNIDLLKIDFHAPSLTFLNKMQALSFMPVISKPTRVTDTTATLIDNIFISTPTLYTSGIFTDDMSDHFQIFILINNYFNSDDITATNNKSIKYRAINSHTLESFREKLLVQDFTPILDNEDYNMAFSDLEKNYL